MEEKMRAENMRWLDPVKSVRKQIKFGPPYLLYFRVKFYVSDPSKLQEEYTRYHFFLQLRKDIVDQKFVVPLAAAILLASYAVQSELRDFNPDHHKNGYLSGLRLVPNQTIEIEHKIMELHKLHKGQTPADAEFNFLDHAKRLDMYGVELHQARVRLQDNMNKEIQLGVTSAGLVVFQNNIKINTFSWAKILKISFKRRQFFIQLRREGTESYDSLLGFNMLSYRACKNLWKSCVEHHTFFRLHTPQRPSRRHFFGVGSKFHYSGRTEYQTLEESKKGAKPEREFTRSLIKRHPPLPRSILEGREMYAKKPSKPLTRINGTSYVRPYESLSKIKVSEPQYIPRKAWVTPVSDEAKAFVPNIPSKLIDYMDEGDELDEIIERTVYVKDVKPEEERYEEPTNVVTIRIKPDTQGRFGFNVKGGADQNLPISVSRVVPATPADLCYPKLKEGDRVLTINGKDTSKLTHEQVVKLIKASCDSVSKELVLTVRPYVDVEGISEEPDFQYIPDVPRGKRKSAELSALDESMLLLSEGLESGATISQFEQLYRRKPGTTTKTARMPDNLARNRYKDILPYDTTRVVLHGGMTDYINASYVNMEIPPTGNINKYIAAQGPLPNTCAEFWQMVWEQECTLVIMVTTLAERGLPKCHRYWPQCVHESVEYGPLQITLIKEEEMPSSVTRQFSVINVETNKIQRITQMQYMSWPDHGVPEIDKDFFNFVLRIRQKRKETTEPVIVHCSAGVGRTGVVILMETAMSLIEANQPVYPLDIVRTMRNQRAMLIQTTSQYRYICEAILKVYNEEVVKPHKEQ